MAMQLRYRERHARIVEDLLHYGKIGDCKVLYGTYQNHTSYYGFMFIKSTKSLVKIYSIYRGYIHSSSFDKAVAEFRKVIKNTVEEELNGCQTIIFLQGYRGIDIMVLLIIHLEHLYL